jgi:hypothetical protein
MFYTVFDYSLNKAIIDPQKAKELEERFCDPTFKSTVFDHIKLVRNANNELIGIDTINTLSSEIYREMFTNALRKVLISGSVELYFLGVEDYSFYATGYKVSPNNIEVLSDDYVKTKLSKQLRELEKEYFHQFKEDL